MTSQCAPQYCSITVRIAKLNHACSSDERKRFPTVHDDTSGVTFALICAVDDIRSGFAVFTSRRSWRASLLYDFPEPGLHI